MNLKLVKPGKSKLFGIYEMPCGHLEEIAHRRIKHGLFRCNTCYDTEMAALAKESGVTLVERLSREKFKIVFDKCGHSKEIIAAQLKMRSVTCIECRIEKYKQEAAFLGFEYIGESNRGKKYRNYKCSFCGDVSIYQPSNIRHGMARCQTCFQKNQESNK